MLLGCSVREADVKYPFHEQMLDGFSGKTGVSMESLKAAFS